MSGQNVVLGSEPKLGSAGAHKVTAGELGANREKNETKVHRGFWDLWDSKGRITEILVQKMRRAALP